jgi:hypothetical protein
MLRGDSIEAVRPVLPAGGGAVPTSPLQSRLRKQDWNVAGCSQEVAEDLIRAHHYARGNSKQFVYLHGLYPARWFWYREAVGVAWWLPPTKAAAKFFAGDEWEGVLALSRLVIEPNVPANACSFLLSKSVRMIDRKRWPVLCTYADSWRGHTGAIYRACGWEYVGETRPTEVWTLNGRMIATQSGPRTRTVAEMQAMGAIRHGQHTKSRFVLRK